MLIQEYEKAIFSIIFRNPSSNIPRRICAELRTDKFGTAQHRKIYQAITNLIVKKEEPDTISVARELGPDLDICGSIEYLESLVRFLALLGADVSEEGYGQWVRVIDNAGRLRQLGLIIQNYSKHYDDFEKLVSETRDVDEFMSNFMSQVNVNSISSRNRYKVIKEAGDEERRYVEKESKGEIVDLIPTGWPNLEKYQIPRPDSFGGIIGLSSSGKTAFALGIVLGVALQLYNTNQPGIISINSLETSGRRIFRRLCCMQASIDGDKLAKGLLSKEQITRYLDTTHFVDQLPIRYDDKPIETNELVWQAIAQNYQEKRVLGISDYLELFSDEGDSEELRLSKMLRNIKRVKDETASCEVLLAQFNKKVTNSSYKMGDLSDSRYTGAYEHALDWGIIIYNLKQMIIRGLKPVVPDGKSGDFAYAVIQKNKEYPVGEEAFEWNPEYARFRDISLPMNCIYRLPSIEF